MTGQLELLLQRELQILADARKTVLYSFEKCAAIGIKASYSPEELESFESFTGRFARLSDILIQKLFRLIDELDLETSGTVRDRINRAEKKNLIVSSDIFVEIRMVRNEIAHEYLPEAIHDLFGKVLALTPHVLDSIDRTYAYCEKFTVKK